MTPIVFTVIVCFLLVAFIAMQYLFLKHIKELEFKLLTGEVPTQSKEIPNQVVEPIYKDIAEVDVSAIANNIKSKLSK